MMTVDFWKWNTVFKEVIKMQPEALFARQLDILKPEVCQVPVHIVGCGATGSFTALSLAKMGVGNITVYDGDSIELHNFPNQFFPIGAAGKNKAEVLKEMVDFFTGVQITAVPEFYEHHALQGIVVSALDTMSGRKLIFENSTPEPGFEPVSFLVDSRTGPEVVRVLSVDMKNSSERDRYAKTLHSDEEAVQLPCTARAIIYSVLSVSSVICKQIKQYLMNQPYAHDLALDLKNDMLMKL
jgi:hypothetical protein